MSLRHKPLFLLAHGAGAPSSHPWMLRWARLLTTIGNVVAFDYPYLAEGRKRPDPLPKLIDRIAPHWKKRGARTPDRSS